MQYNSSVELQGATKMELHPFSPQQGVCNMRLPARNLAHSVVQKLLNNQEDSGVDLDMSPRTAQPAWARSQRVSSFLQEVNQYLRRPFVEAFAVREVATASRELLVQLIAADVPMCLVFSLGSLEFELQKDAMRLFDAMVRSGFALGVGDEITRHVTEDPRIVNLLLNGCARPELAIYCNSMLRSCFVDPLLVEFFLAQRVAETLVELVRGPSFDTSIEAFSTLSDLLLVQPSASAPYLVEHFTDFFNGFDALLQEDQDYTTQRQALKLLGKILLSPGFQEVMILYSMNDLFLQTHMKLLRNRSKNIQVGAFHVFKLFVANPRKTPRVQKLLSKNCVRLIALLETFGSKQPDDAGLIADLGSILTMLTILQQRPRKASSDSFGEIESKGT